MYSLVTSLFAVLALTLAELPPEFKKCNRADADFDQCLGLAIGDAIKDLKAPIAGLPSLEPAVIKEIPIKAETEGANYTGVMSNYQLFGLTTSDFKLAAKLNFASNILALYVTYPQLKHTSDSEFVGTLKGRSITGKGFGSCLGEKENFALTFQLEEYTKDGKSFYRVIGRKLAIIGEGASCTFDTFDGDITTEDLTKLVNENIQLYVGEITDEFEDVLGGLFQNCFEKILENASIDEIFGKV